MRGVVLLKDKDMKHKFLRNFDSNGVWTKDSREIKVIINDEIQTVDMDEYAKEHGIELPDAKSKKHKDIKKEVNTYADMEKQDDSGDTEES